MQGGRRQVELIALSALFGGALAIATAAIFVRLSETGPIATAFWRGALALPPLACWAWLEARHRQRDGALRRVPWNASFVWSGVFFAGDLAFWHWSILLTSVAASTLEANLAPIFVVLIMWAIWKERPRLVFIGALVLALGGVVLLVSPKLGQGTRAFVGDALGVTTAVFYGAYIVAVARLRSAYGTGLVMFRSTLVFTLVLLPLALTGKFVPDSSHGWGLLVGLALIAQFLGQGLIAYALAHLPATFGSVGLYVQPVAAAVYAWLLLGESLVAIQIVGGALTLGGIALARSTVARAAKTTA